MKKKIMYFALVLAIAMLVAVEFGRGWMFFGIGVFFFGEYCYNAAYEHSFTKKQYFNKLKFSRKMLGAHIAWCVATFVLAGLFGILDGYEMTEEVVKGNSFDYVSTHQDGATWLVLVLLLTVRGVLQIFIEKALNENIKLAGDYE